MNSPIIENQSLISIENNIKLEIGKLKFWGELELSFHEMEIIKECLKEKFAEGCETVSSICKKYPHVFTTYMVFFVRYKYNFNFWDAIANDLGVDISNSMHIEIGNCAKNMFARYCMDYSDVRNEVHTNIAPIIYEACLPPESSLDDLFYVLNYDANNIFDPQVIIDELLNMRSYMIRKPLYRFLNRFKNDRAIDFLIEVRDAMISANQRGSKESRYLGNYTKWKELEKTKSIISNRKKQEFQTRPYLFFDTGKKGLCIILPRVIMDNEWIDDTSWNIKSNNGFCKNIDCSILGDEGKRYIDSIIVAVPPSDKYFIKLDNKEGIDEQSSKEWSIDGVSRDKILYFNSNGRLVSVNHLLIPYGIMVVPEGVTIIEKKSLDITEQYYPTSKKDYRIISITPLSNTAYLKYSMSGIVSDLIAKPQINMWFDGQTLFGLDKDTNIFIKVPVLKIVSDGYGSFSGFELRTCGVCYPLEIDNTKENVFDLEKITSSEISQFGTYSVMLYQNGRFLKLVEFCYVPDIETNYSSFITWCNRSFNKTIYKFEILDEWEMIFDGCVVGSDGDNYTVEVPANLGSVKTSLKSMNEDFNFSCEFDLPMQPVEVEILDCEGNVIENLTDKIYKVGNDWFLENQMWLSLRVYGEFRCKEFFVRLRTADGVQQSEVVKFAKNGAANLNISIFNDTLRTCPLPAQLEIICDNDEVQTIPIVLITEKLLMEFPVRYKHGENQSYIILNSKDDGKDIVVRRFGFESCEVHISYSESVLTNNGNSREYPYPEILKDGIYIVSGSKEQEVFNFAEDSSVELNIGNNIVIVNTNNINSANSIDNIVDFLDSILFKINNHECNFDYIDFVNLKGVLKNVQFDDVDIEKLVALAYFANSKMPTKTIEILRKCMRFISTNFLHRGNRYRIIELLICLNAPQAVFDICLNDYALMLFYCDKIGSKMLSAKVEKYSIELSMLLLMSSDASVRDCIWTEKYRDLIGKDAIRKLLSVPHEKNNSIVTSDEQKKFMREISGCKVRICLDDEITGNVESFQSMIVYTNRDIIFDLSKKPDYGVYFGRIKFVDQYVNWYKKSHDKKGKMYDNIKKLMNDAAINYNDIKKAYCDLAKDPQLSQMSKQYMKAIRARCGVNADSRSYLTFFYFEGLAALLVRLPVGRKELDELRTIGIRFMETASIIAPRLSERDILMAETYRYLKMKEEVLCQ